MLKECRTGEELAENFGWLDFEQVQLLLLPVIDVAGMKGGGQHWALLCVNTQTKEVSLYNSCLGSTGVEQAAKQIFEQIEKLAPHLNLRPLQVARDFL